MTPENMTLDELLTDAAQSKDPVAHEIVFIGRRVQSAFIEGAHDSGSGGEARINRR